MLGIKSEFSNNKKLIVLFGGVRMGIGLPVFEFGRIMKNYDYDKYFIRDLNQAWYHMGVDKEINSPDAILDNLKEVISKGKYEKVVFLGNSMGGYAALKYGSLLEVDSILAFSPQTFISIGLRLKYFDFRWSRLLLKLYIRQPFSKKYDLLNLGIIPPQTSIFFSSQDRLDRIHSMRMKSLGDQINLTSYPFDGHGLIRYLNEKGELKKILDTHLK